MFNFNPKNKSKRFNFNAALNEAFDFDAMDDDIVDNTIEVDEDAVLVGVMKGQLQSGDYSSNPIDREIWKSIHDKIKEPGYPLADSRDFDMAMFVERVIGADAVPVVTKIGNSSYLFNRDNEIGCPYISFDCRKADLSKLSNIDITTLFYINGMYSLIFVEKSKDMKMGEFDFYHINKLMLNGKSFHVPYNFHFTDNTVDLLNQAVNDAKYYCRALNNTRSKKLESVIKLRDKIMSNMNAQKYSDEEVQEYMMNLLYSYNDGEDKDPAMIDAVEEKIFNVFNNLSHDKVKDYMTYYGELVYECDIEPDDESSPRDLENAYMIMCGSDDVWDAFIETRVEDKPEKERPEVELACFVFVMCFYPEIYQVGVYGSFEAEYEEYDRETGYGGGYDISGGVNEVALIKILDRKGNYDLLHSYDYIDRFCEIFDKRFDDETLDPPEYDPYDYYDD